MEKIPLLLLFLGHVWVDTSQGILPVVAAKLKDSFQLSYFQVGLLMSVLNFTSSVIQPIFGYVSDRFRTGWFVPTGILWTALAMGLLGWSPNYAASVALVGLAGLGTAAYHPRAMMAVYLISGTRRGLGAAIFSTGGNLGFALGPVLGSLLMILGLGLKGTLGLLPVGALLSAAFLLHPGGFLRREVAGNRPTSGGAETGRPRFPWVPLTAVSLIVALRSWVYMSFITYLPLFFQSRGIRLTKGSLILTLFLACGAAAGLYGGHLSDRFGRRRIIVVTHLVYPLVAALMLVSQGAWLWVLAAASGATLLASFSVTLVLTQELLPRSVGLASGLILGLGFGTGGLGTAVSGFLADYLGLYPTFWILAGVPLLGAFLATFLEVPRVAPTVVASGAG